MAETLDDAAIDAFAAAGRRFEGTDRRAPLREALARAGHDGPGQTAGRFWPVACVALEITQRCNLDCTLCYLSEHAEMARDIPLPVLFARLATVLSHYGPGATVQITGGDPTLRRIEDLEALVHEIRRLGLRACLMTNGIRATRPFLTRLAAAGLQDVAFHVDTTQGRATSEVALNPVREDFLVRARGLGLRVFFNTTVHAGNLAELPALARFFRGHAAEITMASFQMQADSGRGTLRRREDAVTRERVVAALSKGFGTTLDVETARVGHPSCNAYAPVLVAGRHAVSPLVPKLFHEGLAALEAADPGGPATVRVGRLVARAVRQRPGLALRAVAHALGLLWRLRAGLVASRGRVHRMAVFIHDFMDADALDPERCAACVFMVATEDGPLSMCVHNARRDRHLFAPARVAGGWWSAATGQTTPEPVHARPEAPPPKRRKGRLAVRRGRHGTVTEAR